MKSIDIMVNIEYNKYIQINNTKIQNKLHKRRGD